MCYNVIFKEEMDKQFIDNLEDIRIIACSLNRLYGERYEIDELVNASYIGYKRAITNNPSLIEKFKKRSTFFFRVKNDIKDYVREESHLKIKKRMENKDIHCPKFLSTSFIKNREDDRIKDYTPCHTDPGYNEVDDKDFLDDILNKAGLSNTEWAIIQGYFYDEKLLKDIGNEVGIKECTVCNNKKSALKKCREVVLEMSF